MVATYRLLGPANPLPPPPASPGVRMADLSPHIVTTFAVLLVTGVNMSNRSDNGTFVVRDLEQKDLHELLGLLAHLTKVEEMSDERLGALFEERVRCNILTKVVVDTSNNRIVGTAALIVERKFIRGGQCVGHIEDVVTDPSYRGRGLGAMLIRNLCDAAERNECYKVILDCAEENASFYGRYGFVKCETQMRLNLPRPSQL